MYNVRYYGAVIHPDHFKGTFGLLIRVLNWMRWSLETFVQRMALRYFASRGALPTQRRVELERLFDLDVKAEKLEKERTSPLHPIPEVPVTRAERYVQGSQSSALDDLHTTENELPKRPERLDNMVAAYGDSRRIQKYARGRRYTVANADGDFEPVDSEK